MAFEENNNSSFIRKIQINPTPMCILATKEQLDKVIAKCTKPEDFSVLQVYPTYLGNFYDPPLVVSLKDYISQHSGNPPTFVGPLLINHTMDYIVIFSQLLGQLPECCRVKAIGIGGEVFFAKSSRLLYQLQFICVA